MGYIVIIIGYLIGCITAFFVLHNLNRFYWKDVGTPVALFSFGSWFTLFVLVGAGILLYLGSLFGKLLNAISKLDSEFGYIKDKNLEDVLTRWTFGTDPLANPIKAFIINFRTIDVNIEGRMYTVKKIYPQTPKEFEDYLQKVIPEEYL